MFLINFFKRRKERRKEEKKLTRDNTVGTVYQFYNYLTGISPVENMYIIKQAGGLGNQLFITSFAYALYKKTGSRYNILFDTSFYIDPFKNM
ncbi:MAG: hypothetical protein LBH46_04300, partial [Rickettsiales bacterium]|nr:hypothetical protein [Rickettsiales bacterium]